jgi:hypothetical protein
MNKTKMLSLSLAFALGLGCVDTCAQRQAARGWLELEHAQRTYRERVEPLPLPSHRQLEVIERSQRLDLRQMQQKDQRALSTAERESRLAPRSNLGADPIPFRDATTNIRRRAQRYRQRLHQQQSGLPFGR